MGIFDLLELVGDASRDKAVATIIKVVEESPPKEDDNSACPDDQYKQTKQPTGGGVCCSKGRRLGWRGENLVLSPSVKRATMMLARVMERIKPDSAPHL